MACNEYDPAENLKKKPSKSILKSSSSFETTDRRPGKKSLADKAKNAKWDEMNIIATLHPADKDYGHMKIHEPKTPYERTLEEDETDSLDIDLLAEKIAKGSSVPAKILRRCSENESSDDEEEEEEETPEQKAHRKLFDSKRKAHYNEFFAAKMARQLMEEDDEDEDTVEKKEKNADDDDGEVASKSGTDVSSTD